MINEGHTHYINKCHYIICHTLFVASERRAGSETVLDFVEGKNVCKTMESIERAMSYAAERLSIEQLNDKQREAVLAFVEGKDVFVSPPVCELSEQVPATRRDPCCYQRKGNGLDCHKDHQYAIMAEMCMDDAVVITDSADRQNIFLEVREMPGMSTV